MQPLQRSRSLFSARKFICDAQKRRKILLMQRPPTPPILKTPLRPLTPQTSILTHVRRDVLRFVVVQVLHGLGRGEVLSGVVGGRILEIQVFLQGELFFFV